METAVRIAGTEAEDPIKIIEELRCFLEAKDRQIKLLEDKDRLPSSLPLRFKV